MSPERVNVVEVADTESFSIESTDGISEGFLPHLILIIERTRPLAGGARYGLANVDRVTIGRTSARSVRRFVENGVATLAIGIPDRRLSTEHAEIVLEGGKWRLTDRESTNGSFVSHLRVTSTFLSDGDLIVLGGTFIRFRASLRTTAVTLGDVDSSTLSGLPAAFGTVNPGLTRDLERLTTVARSNIPILLLGETGTGKEIMARAVHEESLRRGPFVGLNCGALPGPLVESLLFGHLKGAFSGATRDEPGALRAADNGTLLLDEIGDMPIASQVVLLRALQEREVTPIGATQPIPVNLRIVAASHRPLDQLVATGRFRADLLARLSGFIFALPPLRERIDDIGLLLANILRMHNGPDRASVEFGTRAVEQLLGHSWPNNVRELAQCIAVARTLAEGGRIATIAIAAGCGAPSGGTSVPLSRHDAELRAELVRRLTECDGNVTKAAQAMGKARTQLQRWLKRLAIDSREYRR